MKHLAVGAVALALIAASIVWVVRRPGGAEDAMGSGGVPGERIPTAVEVMNGAGIDGLAAATTRRLRALGFDVVYYGTAAADSHAVTRLLARRGDTTAARAVRTVLGFGVVVDEPDPRRLVDVTVLLGRDAADFRP